jgi:fatty-acyl-CoA synthase
VRTSAAVSIKNHKFTIGLFLCTSGTTGLPKGVVYHHRGAYLNAIGEIIEAHLDSTSVYLWTLPMFHCNGW